MEKTQELSSVITPQQRYRDSLRSGFSRRTKVEVAGAVSVMIAGLIGYGMHESAVKRAEAKSYAVGFTDGRSQQVAVEAFNNALADNTLSCFPSVPKEHDVCASFTLGSAMNLQIDQAGDKVLRVWVFGIDPKAGVEPAADALDELEGDCGEVVADISRQAIDAFEQQRKPGQSDIILGLSSVQLVDVRADHGKKVGC